MKQLQMPHESRAGTGTTSSKKKVSRMTLTGILSLAAVFFMVISVQAKNETATENNDTPIMKMAQITTEQSVEPAAYFARGTSVMSAADVLARNENPILEPGISVSGMTPFLDDKTSITLTSFRAESLGGGPLKTSLVLLTGADEGGGYPYSLANGYEGKGSGDLNVTVIV